MCFAMQLMNEYSEQINLIGENVCCVFLSFLYVEEVQLLMRSQENPINFLDRFKAI